MSDNDTLKHSYKEEKTSSPIIYDFNPRSLPPEYLRAIGLVVAASSQTEHILNEFIGSLLGIDNIQALALTIHMPIPLKDNVIRALAELDAPSVKELDKIDDLLDTVEEAFRERNTIVHNAFVTHPNTKEILSHRLKARGSLQLQLTPISVDEINSCADKVYNAGMDIVTFMTSRGLEPVYRTKPLRQPVNRKKKARAERGNISNQSL